jgi:hypothetical protein
MVLAGIDLAWQSNKNPTAIACGEITHNVLSLTTIHPAVLMKFWNPCYRSENKKSSLLLRLCFYNFQQLNSYLIFNDQRGINGDTLVL